MTHLILSLSSDITVKISLFILSGVSSLLFILIAYIVSSFKKQLEEIDYAIRGDDGAMSKLTEKVQTQEVRHERQKGELDSLKVSIDNLEVAIKSLKQELTVISSALSNQFQTRDNCDLKSEQLMASIVNSERARKDNSKKTEHTLEKINTTLNRLTNVVVRLETQQEMQQNTTRS